MQDENAFEMGSDVCGVLVQYPATDGTIHDYKVNAVLCHRIDCLVVRLVQCPATDGTIHDYKVRWDAVLWRSRLLSRGPSPRYKHRCGSVQLFPSAAHPTPALHALLCRTPPTLPVQSSLPHLQALASKAAAAKVKVVVATDLLALTKLAPPGEWGADIVIGSAQVGRSQLAHG